MDFRLKLELSGFPLLSNLPTKIIFDSQRFIHQSGPTFKPKLNFVNNQGPILTIYEPKYFCFRSDQMHGVCVIPSCYPPSPALVHGSLIQCYLWPGPIPPCWSGIYNTLPSNNTWTHPTLDNTCPSRPHQYSLPGTTLRHTQVEYMNTVPLPNYINWYQMA